MKKFIFSLLFVCGVLAVTATSKVEAAPAPTPAPKVGDVTCNGFWCGYGDNKVCCNREYNSCCRYPNSDSYYCCDR